MRGCFERRSCEAPATGDGPLKNVPVVVVHGSTTIDIIGKPRHSGIDAIDADRFAKLERMVTELYESHVEEKERRELLKKSMVEWSRDVMDRGRVSPDDFEVVARIPPKQS